MFTPFRSRLALAAGLSVLVLAAACGDSSPSAPSAPPVNVAFSQTDLVVGTGAQATAASTITVKYTGWVYDSSRTDNKGTQFDTNTTGATFALSGLIQGWIQGVPGMRVGGVRRLVIPPSLGYGAQQNGPIPANSTLVFDIELVAVQ